MFALHSRQIIWRSDYLALKNWSKGKSMMISNYLLRSIFVDRRQKAEERRHCTRRTWRCRTTKNHMARRARRLIARRIIARKPHSPFALDSKYITIYITQTFNNIQNVPYIYKIKLHNPMMHKLRIESSVVGSSSRRSIQNERSENKWQLNSVWPGRIKIYSLINNRTYINHLRERERERREIEREL